jgi:hypothetical protein
VNTGRELYRTKPHGFHVVEYTNDLNRTEYQVRNWRGTVVGTRRFVEDAIQRADELQKLKLAQEGGSNG